MKKPYVVAAIMLAVLVVLVGFFVPLGSYTPTKSVCPYGEPPVVRLHMIMGDTIQKVQDADVPHGPTEGCSQQVTYNLYLF